MHDPIPSLVPSVIRAAALLAACLSFGPSRAAAQEQKQEKPQVAVGKCREIPGALIERDKAGAPWKLLKSDDAVLSEALLIALPEAQIVSNNGAVQLIMMADISRRGPLPVLESAVRIHENPKVDLDITLSRGIVVFKNLKDQGAGKVTVRFRGQTWNITLKDPGALVGMEIYGRYCGGCRKFLDKSGEKTRADVMPSFTVFLLVREGHATIHTGKQELAMDEPPGPALLQWDSDDNEAEVTRLEKAPPSLRPTTQEEINKYKTICDSIKHMLEKPVDSVPQEFRDSPDDTERRVAAVLAGALDQVPQMIDALSDTQHADVRDTAVRVLRNWIGRGPRQLERLYQGLTDHGKMTPNQAKTAIQLLFGFDDDQQEQPATYELLIGYLQHDSLPIRELARWHLVRLVPKGQKFDYDAGASEEKRKEATEKWKALIPEGKLPPSLKSGPVEKK